MAKNEKANAQGSLPELHTIAYPERYIAVALLEALGIHHRQTSRFIIVIIMERLRIFLDTK